MKNFYEVGKAYVWQNATGNFAWLNGRETIVTSNARLTLNAARERIFVGMMTDTPSRQFPGQYVLAERGDLRPKNTPSGGQSITDLFNLTYRVPA